MTVVSTIRTFLLPDLGEGLTEAEVVRWLVAVGDVVAVDAPVVEVETAKSLVEVPSPYAGVVAELHGAEGSSIAVGRPLITIDSAAWPDGPPTAADPIPAESMSAESMSAESMPADPMPAESIAGETAVAEPAAETYREEEKAGSGNVLVGYGTPDGTGATRRRKPRKSTADPGHGIAATRTATPTAAARADAGRATSSRVPLVISPLVRRLARDAKVDLTAVAGSGPGGVITRRDVDSVISANGAGPAHASATAQTAQTAQTAETGTPQVASDVPSAEAGALAASEGTDARTGLPVLLRTPMSGFRKAAAATLSRSRSEIPEATTWVDVDATALVELRESLRTTTDPGPGLLALMARFVVAGLRRYPELNGTVDTGRAELVQYDGVNLGLAAQTERGLVVPAVAGAHTMTARSLDAEIRRLTAAAREGRVTAKELACGTFTLNNYGSFGVDGSAAIINYPQVAILGVGRIIDRPWVVDGAIAVRKLTQLSLVFDHRVCDGGAAAGFLRFVADAFESPASAFADL